MLLTRRFTKGLDLSCEILHCGDPEVRFIDELDVKVAIFTK